MASTEAASGAAESALSGAPPRRMRVLVNASAGQKGVLPTNTSSVDAVQDVCRRFLPSAEVHVTESADEARDLTRTAIADGYDVVVAAGGDGTIGQVATELLDTPVSLGVLPLGSVMNIGRMLGLPRELEAAAEALLTGVERRIDVGEANGEPFYETASVGMNAAIFREAQQFEEGDYLSPLRAIRAAFRYRPARMDLRLDDRQVRSRALMVTISNGPYTGVGMTVAPDARLDDGRFDVRVFRHYSKIELIRHLAAIAFGRYRYTPHARTYRAARVRVEGARPLPARADSNDLGTTPLECVVRRGALRVIVPAESPASTGETPAAAATSA